MYLATKFQVPSIILTKFKEGEVGVTYHPPPPPPPQKNEPLKIASRLELNG